MNLRKRIQRIERQVNLQLHAEEENDPQAEEERLVAFVDRLLEMPVEELVPGEPELDQRALEAYYAIVLSRRWFVARRPDVFSKADVKEWQARERHAESLVDALEGQEPTSGIRSAIDASIPLWAGGWRIRSNGVYEVIAPPWNYRRQRGHPVGADGRRK